MLHLVRRVHLTFAFVALAAPVLAQPVDPLDQPFPGTIALSADLSDVGHKIFRIHEIIPAKPGPMALHYPKWIPGEHGPTGTLDGVTGLVITAGGKRIPWRRDHRHHHPLLSASTGEGDRLRHRPHPTRLSGRDACGG